MRRVLVTRPEPGASQTARRLEGLGFEPILMPLSELRPLAVEVAAVPGSASAVAVTSAAALRHAPQWLLERLGRLPCHAVGAKTAEAARAAGFAETAAGPGDAAGLARMLAERLGAGAEIVYLCGRVRLPAFEQRLAAAGLSVGVIETYDTVAVAPDIGKLQGGIDAVLLHSAVTARSLLEIAASPDAAGAFETASLLCLSRRIADALGDRFATKIRIAAEPTEEALLFLLEEQS